MSDFILETLLRIVGKERSDISKPVQIRTRDGSLYLVPCKKIELVHQTSGEDYICFSWEHLNKGLAAVVLNIKDISAIKCEFKKKCKPHIGSAGLAKTKILALNHKAVNFFLHKLFTFFIGKLKQLEIRAIQLFVFDYGRQFRRGFANIVRQHCYRNVVSALLITNQYCHLLVFNLCLIL